MVWQQVYNPFGNMIVSTALAAIPVVVMLVCLGLLHIKAHYAAGLGLLSALVIAVFAFGMPADMAGKAAFLGGISGLLPIGWIVLNIIFLQQLTQQNGSFQILQDSIAASRARRASARRLRSRRPSSSGWAFRRSRHRGSRSSRTRRPWPSAHWARRSSRWPRCMATT